MTTMTSRRLSARRGSTSASDPHAKYAHLLRESSSILTIVRVTSPPAIPPPSASAGPTDPPPSPRRAHRRLGSNPNPSPAISGSPDAPGRLSFAFSSFGAPHQQANSGGGGGGSPRLRPSSPHRSSPSASFSNLTRLSPEQLLDVAKQATNPRLPSSPSSTSSLVSHSPILHARPQSPQALPPASVAPTTFTQLPPGVYLPFLDRPTEVSALLASPPSAKLFVLLAQTFTKSPKQTRKNDQLPVDTADWSFDDLAYWLTKTTREEASDAFWVQSARRCILQHSELIWERLKGALGVPPELDVEFSQTQYEEDVFEDDDSEEADLTSGESAKSSAGSSPITFRIPTKSSVVPQMSEIEDMGYFALSPIHNEDANGIFIEPVFACPDISTSHPPPMSLPASLSSEANGLGDIGEEDEEQDSMATPSNLTPEVIEAPPIQGLRISTSDATITQSSPLIQSSTTGLPLRSPSFSARRSHSPTLWRSGSMGGGTGGIKRSGSFGSVHSISSDRPYDPVADRVPGNPIFPTNFASLAVGPTLAANNPALRSPPMPPQSKFSVGMLRRSSTKSMDRGNRFRRSWGNADDYAVTVASGSSAGGSVRDDA
ncbi:unnamed protein product [Mycena citricolor]|uniref:Uncharacterized protein n=1 Tax=Mycena citricolor TaxID=2018698 RepID=A0AAD2Q1Z8_9AGAR|nr:unnamed protein product [Mycena citricolor]CAK5273696.1 unnamed protein product [Mycena citricolor]